MTRFRHLILTRFNVKIPEYDTPGPEWLEHRLGLFERFCLPSLQNQSNLDFDWLLFCDKDSSQNFRARIQKYSKWSNVRAVFVEGYFTQATVQLAVADFAKGFTHLITTRLDNDDAVCRNFVEIVQNHFSGQDFEFLNFTKGYIWHNGKIYAGEHQTNSFISLVEKTEEISTVFCGNHMRLSRLGPIRQIEQPAGWLQVVHSRNLVNAVWGRPVATEIVYGQFGIPFKNLTL